MQNNDHPFQPHPLLFGVALALVTALVLWALMQ